MHEHTYSTPEQLHELFQGETGVRNNSAEGGWADRADLLVVGDNSPGVRLIPAENHRTAREFGEYKPR